MKIITIQFKLLHENHASEIYTYFIHISKVLISEKDIVINIDK